MRLGSVLTGMAAVASASHASTFSPTRPPAVPLAVRSPYLNTWLNGDSGGLLPGTWPQFWTAQTQGWQGFVQVDGTTYNWMGAAPGPSTASQVSLQYTSLRSIFILDVAGKITMTVTFFSPVYPEDLGRQSQQFSYVDVKVNSSDGNDHSVQVYMDISGEFVSGDLTQGIEWSYGTTGGVTYHQIARQQQFVFGEAAEIAAWGTWFLSTAAGQDVTMKSGKDTVVRGQFIANGSLDNGFDPAFRAVSDAWPVFAISKDFGEVNANTSEVVFSLGLVQDEVILFQGSGNLTSLPGLWSSYYTSDVDAMVAFYQDYDSACLAADALDAQIQMDSVAAGGQDYATITTLAVRQAFGGLQFAGTASNPLIFLKEISSNSDIQTVDVIFPAYPILLYLNPVLGKYLLEPLYQNQEAPGNYPNAWAEHDLGTFPIAKGYRGGSDEPMPLEECGNMVIMTLAYAQRANDTAYISQHWDKLQQWAGYLVAEALIPADQLSTDDFAGTLANQTNLALKGIIGLKAMSEMALLTGNTDAWGATADSYLQKWKGYSMGSTNGTAHTTLSYGNSETYGLLYNLYADRLLGLNFVDQSVYDMQSAWYLKFTDFPYGVPLDSRHTWTKADWEMFCAAIASPPTQGMFISKLALWIGETNTGRAMTDLYEAGTGTFPVNGPDFVARPVVGGVFALLALPQVRGSYQPSPRAREVPIAE